MISDTEQPPSDGPLQIALGRGNCVVGAGVTDGVVYMRISPEQHGQPVGTILSRDRVVDSIPAGSVIVLLPTLAGALVLKSIVDGIVAKMTSPEAEWHFVDPKESP